MLTLEIFSLYTLRAWVLREEISTLQVFGRSIMYLLLNILVFWRLCRKIGVGSYQTCIIPNLPPENIGLISDCFSITNTLDVQYRPIIGCIDGVVMVNFAMTFLVGSDVYPLAADAPPLIPEQRQALEILSQICREQSLKLNPIAGDILFVNNLSILHARDAYQDRPELGKTRQLLSLMLRDDRLALQKPKCFREAGDNVFSRSPEKQILLTVDEWESFAAGSQRPKLKPRHD